MRGVHACAAAGLALALAACAPAKAPLPEQPVPADGTIRIVAEPVPLDPSDAARDRIGDFTFAGAVTLTSPDTARLHGLSDLEIAPDGGVMAVSDEGDLLRARLQLGKDGRLVGLSGGRITALPGLDGKPLPGKLAADAEGLALLPGGDLLVSFEQNHRIWLYPAAGGPPRPAPAPDAVFPANGGMEALGPDPAAGPDAYVVGGEESGQTWTCRLSADCRPGPPVAKDGAFGLVAVRRLSEGRTAWLLRAYDPLRGSRIELRIAGPHGDLASVTLSRPLTVDNFEGLAATPIAGGYRFYLLSDDNFQSLQRTILMALDWRPHAKETTP
ncbi:MAG: esterase-like activity of phytase family protein [Phenylobacterium sp.]